MMVIKIGEGNLETIEVGPGQTRAAEHQGDFVMKDIGRNTAPQQLHRRAPAVSALDAGTAKFEHLPSVGEEWRNVVFGSGVEAAQSRGGAAANEAVGADDHPVACVAAPVEKEEMIAMPVEAIDVASPLRHLG
jgi:hypothetical protein